MSRKSLPSHDPRIARALATLETLIRERYSDAAFIAFVGEDPEGVYLHATVDIEDPDEVMDVVADMLYHMQVEQQIPVYVVPVQPLERVAEQLRSKYDLADLVSRIPKGYKAKEVDVGPPVGKEAW
jgi:hypothetical protein